MKKRLFETASFSVFMLFYCSLKVTGTVYLQRTAFVFLQLPASILAWILQPVLLQHPVRGVMLRTMLTWSTEPSFSITICTITLPCAPSFALLRDILCCAPNIASRLSYLRGIQAYCLLSGIRGLLRQRSNLTSSGFSISLMGQSSFYREFSFLITFMVNGNGFAYSYC